MAPTENRPTELEELHQLTVAGEQIDNEKTRIVGDLRNRPAPVPWSAIGEALNTTKQAAQQKYSKLMGDQQ